MANGKPSRRSHKLCCAVTEILFVIITLFFTIFKPKDPKISLYPEGIKDIDFSALTPNVIRHCHCNWEPKLWKLQYRNTTSYVTYHGEVVGEAPIEQRYAPARHNLNITTSVELKAGKLRINPHLLSDFAGGSLNLTSTAVLPGKVIVLNIFKFHATVYNSCNISDFISPQKVESMCKLKL